MDCFWLKTSASLIRGITTINLLDDSRFEQFFRRIVSKIKLQDSEIFSEDEIQKLTKIFQINEDSLLLAIKTLVYIFKRLMKYILMPLSLKNDLKTIGMNNEKADFVVKIWSAETKMILDELGSVSIEKPSNSLDFTWSLNAELSSDICKKTKAPIAYLTLSRDNEETELEMTHPEMYSVFLQFEAIQNELDNLGI